MKFLFLICFYTSLMNAFAQEEKKQAIGSLNHFRVATMMLYAENQSSYSMIGSWNPKLYKYKNSIFGLNLGGSVFEDQEKNKFLLLEYTATWRYLWTERWKTEVSGGFQTISGKVGSYGVIGGTVHYTLNKNAFNLDDVFIGYTNFNYTEEVIHQIRLGVGFHF